MAVGLLSVVVVLGSARGTQDAVANGDTRTISIRHMHTKEEVTVTFRRNGQYDSAALQQLNWILRDWRRDEQIRMDPRLFDIAWEVHREVGSSSPFHVVSAYRSPETNSALRRRSRGVAKHSQHTQGKAMDFFLPDASPAQIRAIGMKMQRGGVGFYPTAYTPFIHLDVGSVRSWPRMPRDQLARLFPDGRTVHIAADGQPMAGYEVAKAEIIARGGTVGGFGTSDFDEGAIMQSGSRSLWSMLFGDAETADARPGARGRAQQGGGASSSAMLAYAPSVASENGAMRDSGGSWQAPTMQQASETIARARPGRGAAPARAAETAPAAETPAAVAPAEAARPATPPTPAPPRLVMAPFPSQRPTGLNVQLAAVSPGPAGQRLNWQAGPDGRQTSDAGAVEAAARLVAAPVPPIRPNDLVAVAALRMTAAAPPAVASPGQAPSPAAEQASAIAPPPGGGRLVAVAHPPPPERPRAITVAATAMAGLQPRDLRAPPSAPAAPVMQAPPSQGISAPQATSAGAGERQTLDNLFAAAAAGLPLDLSKVQVARTRSSAAPVARIDETSPAAALGFTQREPNDTRTDRFTGPSVRPLPTTYTSR